MFGREIDDSGSMSLSLHPELIQDVMQTLINTNVIGDKALNYLKQDEVKTFEPTMIMDLRHNQIKEEHKQCHSKHHTLEEARRLIHSEEQAEKERVKELRLVNREIKKFQKQLEAEHKKLINDCNFQRVSAKKLWMVNGDKNPSPVMSVAATRKKTSDLKEMKNSEFLAVQTSKFQEIHYKEFECEEGNQNFIEVSIKKVESKSNLTDQNELRGSSKALKIEEAEQKVEQSYVPSFEVVKNEKEYKLMKKVWIKWMKFVQCKRIISTEEQKQQVHEELKIENKIILYPEHTEKIILYDQNVSDAKTLGEENMSEYNEDCDNFANEYYFEQCQNQKSKFILKKYFMEWKSWVLQKRELKHLRAEKHQREEKIKKYIELISTKKKSIVEAKSTSSSSVEENSMTGMSDFSDSCSKVSKASSKSAGYGEKYQHRFKAQKNIIATQKSKIEDQNKLIEDLKSFQLRLEAEMSQRESSKNLKATLQNFDSRLKSKAAFVHRALSSDSGYKSLERTSEDNSETHQVSDEWNTFKGKSVSLEIVQRMEKRNEERKKKWQAAQERRRQLEEEKLRKIKEEEDMKQQRELEAKQRKIEQLREKQRLEKQREEERIKEREIFQQNCQIAEESNRRRLLTKGLQKLRYNVLVTKRDTFIADDHYKTKLKLRYLRAWRLNVRQKVAIKINEAVHFYNRRLAQKALQRFLEVYKDYTQKLQAADDMYDMKMQSKYFNKWYNISCMTYLEIQEKMKIAVNFHNRRIVRSHFNQWKRLPKIMFQERSREQRLRVLRERVQELLPDYRPVPLDDED